MNNHRITSNSQPDTATPPPPASPSQHGETVTWQSRPVQVREARIVWFCTIRYDTIRDAILTCTQKPTWVSLIYRTEPTTKKVKKQKKLNVNRLICSEVTVNSLGNPYNESWRRKRKGCGREDLQKRKDLTCTETLQFANVYYNMAACHKQHADGFSVIVTSLVHYIKCWLLNSNTHSNTDCGFMDVSFPCTFVPANETTTQWTFVPGNERVIVSFPGTKVHGNELNVPVPSNTQQRFTGSG